MSAKVVVSLGSVALSLVLSGCVASGATDVAIEMRAGPVLDVAPSQRVLIAGFVVGGTSEIDTNEETVRLLRSQLRSKTSLKVIDAADVLPLTEMVTVASSVTRSDGKSRKPGAANRITSEEELRGSESVFANTAYWKRLGEEYSDPIIVTGTVLFTVETEIVPDSTRREQDKTDSFGRHWVVPRAPGPIERTSCALRSQFIFIDGRTGTPLYSEVFREAASHDAGQRVPALSSYFELMDRVLPGFLNTVSVQTFRAIRTLLK